MTPMLRLDPGTARGNAQPGIYTTNLHSPGWSVLQGAPLTIRLQYKSELPAQKRKHSKKEDRTREVIQRRGAQ